MLQFHAARSPVFSHLSTSLYGLTTIRAFRAEEEFCKQFDDHQDMHTSSWFLFISTTRWFGIWLDWLSVIYIGVVAYSFMLFANGLFQSMNTSFNEFFTFVQIYHLKITFIDGAQVGLAVSNAMMLTGIFHRSNSSS